ncbi:ExbD/TolR family protein [Pontiella sulfatireligans]|uniref:Biopolymer transport protein ExbD n=1 Tax=Pontiella sulfatireligans TaxID=2750658 RepID=A0A6C2UR67_9BACT|nr:biopolymer transporter ExbD [Pontiella sulfatireligans]VGO21784.1 Biopolymer transport protein ExbD [Pontiella sulfatireligans]
MKNRFQNQSNGGINMTPMIDVVFQMIIFFVCTAQLEQEQFSEFIKLPGSPNAPEMAQEKDPRTITIEVDGKGKVSIARTPLSISKLRKILNKTVADYGVHGPSIPILIRADGDVRHGNVKQVMDACTGAGLYKIAFVAVKDSLK